MKHTFLVLLGILIVCLMVEYVGCRRDAGPVATTANTDQGLTAVQNKVGTAGSCYREDPALEKVEAQVICPGPTLLNGVDVSSYEYPINWTQVKAAGKVFMITRQSHGMARDTNFFGFWRDAQAVGLIVGAYQFFDPTLDAIQQASMFVNDLKAAGNYAAPNIPPIIDIEGTFSLSPATVLSQVNLWLDYVQTNLGRKPMLYTNPGTWIPLGEPTPTPFPYYWLANWTNKCPKVPAPWTHYEFWQYTAKGTVPGIPGHSKVDLDYFNGTYAQMTSL